MNYDAGVQLYLEYGSSAVLKRVLTQEAETPFKQQKLREALLQIVATVQQPAEQKAAVLQISQPEPQQLKGWPPQPIEDQVLAALYNQWRPLYGEMKSLQHRIDEVAKLGTTDRNKLMEAGQMAIQILNLEDQVLAIYRERDYYYQHQQLPAQDNTNELLVVDPLKWPIELETHKRYVRRYTKKIADSPDNKNVANWASLLKKSLELVAHYKKLLKIDE